MPGLLLYYAVCKITLVLFKVFFRLRSRGTSNMPARGPVLVAVNHQSHLDAEAVSIVLPRHVVFIARAGLFKNPLFGWFIRALNSVPIKEGGSDTAAIRAALEQLARGRAVLIFPEGTRSPDGAMRPLKRGVWLLLSRGKCPILPVGVDGGFDAWPRGARFPRLFAGARIAVAVGAPINPDELLLLGPERGLLLLGERLDALRLQARAMARDASRGRWPPAGPGDAALSANAAVPGDARSDAAKPPFTAPADSAAR